MKKIQGIIDPISLGFVLSGIIFGVGISTANHDIKAGKVAKAKVESRQNVTVKHIVKPIQEDEHPIYSY